MESQEAHDWKDALRRLSQKTWDESGRALLLSRIPSLLQAEGIDLSALLEGRRLRPFLQAEAGNQLQLLQSEANPIIWGVLPASVKTSLPADQYLQRAEPKAEKAQRFAPAVWKAFTTPVEAGFRRWLMDEPSPHFRDLPEGETAEGGREVPSHLIAGVPPGAEVNISKTLAAIGTWSADNRVDPSRLGADRKRMRASKPEAELVSYATQLDQLLSLLLPGELTRIAVPLDVVARLAATRAKARS